ncbi:hypothetical protein CIL05_00670 [Virgibacillus profundi]|uniref:Amidohydrolase-related domain-containing protein n=1 Tax=Virgibacillus profundi TaxID=2024555 RepID=A0A2A2IJD3_9BACI|nr:amidohydrolase family protein [Virgibacillus profundi]PAV31205.1 hypothetical protein CIL05_00670 [Virgibacillus profundi]PXY55388.1 amidohydrolase [Virgibacillus profundi]
MKIDSHHHFWKLSRQDYGWLTEEQGILFQDYLPDDLQPILKKHQIDRTIVVQAAPTLAETAYLLELYHQNEFIAGVVGWINLDSDSFGEKYQQLRENKGFVGIRPMLQDIEDDRWLLRPRVMENIEKLLHDDFPLDLLIYPRHLPIVLELLEEFPKLRCVINHAAKPDITNGISNFWENHISGISRFENVMCKISGLITEADHRNWKQKDFIPFGEHLLKAFGPNRLMFGSDWPVCLLAGDYGDVYELFGNLVSEHVTKDEFAKMIGNNAKNFYKLNL